MFEGSVPRKSIEERINLEKLAKSKQQQDEFKAKNYKSETGISQVETPMVQPAPAPGEEVDEYAEAVTEEAVAVEVPRDTVSSDPAPATPEAIAAVEAEKDTEEKTTDAVVVQDPAASQADGMSASSGILPDKDFVDLSKDVTPLHTPLDEEYISGAKAMDILDNSESKAVFDAETEDLPVQQPRPMDLSALPDPNEPSLEEKIAALQKPKNDRSHLSIVRNPIFEAPLKTVQSLETNSEQELPTRILTAVVTADGHINHLNRMDIPAAEPQMTDQEGETTIMEAVIDFRDDAAVVSHLSDQDLYAGIKYLQKKISESDQAMRPMSRNRSTPYHNQYMQEAYTRYVQPLQQEKEKREPLPLNVDKKFQEKAEQQFKYLFESYLLNKCIGEAYRMKTDEPLYARAAIQEITDLLDTEKGREAIEHTPHFVDELQQVIKKFSTQFSEDQYLKGLMAKVNDTISSVQYPGGRRSA